MTLAAQRWDPGQYERFKDERSRPFHELLSLLAPAPGARAIDLGCGTGELTRLLHETLGCRETVGLDGSADMLAKSRAGGGVRFVRGDIAAFARGDEVEGVPAGDRFDLIVSNAALHWLPDHATLLAGLGTRLAPGGRLAVQVPANHGHASHTVAAEIASEPPFAVALGGWRHRDPVPTAEEYARRLDALGFGDLHVRLQVFVHHLAGRESVVEWVRGTLLTDYRRRLSDDLYAEFERRYAERLLEALPDERPFVYPFARILFRGTRA